jgi:hypothetical protein
MSQIKFTAKKQGEQAYIDNIIVASNDDNRFDFRFEIESRKIDRVNLDDKFKINIYLPDKVEIERMEDPNWERDGDAIHLLQEGLMFSSYKFKWVGPSSSIVREGNIGGDLKNIKLRLSQKNNDGTANNLKANEYGNITATIDCSYGGKSETKEGSLDVSPLKVTILDEPTLLEGFKSSFCWLNGNMGHQGRLWSPYKEMEIGDEGWFKNTMQLVLVWTPNHLEDTTLYIDFPIAVDQMPDDAGIVSAASKEYFKLSLDPKNASIINEDDIWRLKKIGVKRIEDVNYQRWRLDIKKAALSKVPYYKSIYVHDLQCPTGRKPSFVRLSWAELGQEEIPEGNYHTIADLPKEVQPVITNLSVSTSEYYIGRCNNGSELLSCPNLDDVKLSWNIMPLVGDLFNLFSLSFDIDSENNGEDNINQKDGTLANWSNADFSIRQLLTGYPTFNDKAQSSCYSSIRKYKLSVKLRETKSTVAEKTVIVQYINNVIFVNQDAKGNNSGQSWKHAYTDLQKAIDFAKEGHQVWIAKGDYYGSKNLEWTQGEYFHAKNSMELYGGFKGGETTISERKANLYSWIKGTKDNQLAIGIHQQLMDNIPVARLVIEATSGVIVIDGLGFIGNYHRGPRMVTGNSFAECAVYIKKKDEQVSNCNLFVRNCSFTEFFKPSESSVINVAFPWNNKYDNCDFGW